MKHWRTLLFLIVSILFLAACAESTAQITPSPVKMEEIETSLPANPEDTEEPVIQDRTAYEQYEIVTLLPKDAIPAIDDPEFLTADEADQEYAPDELVIGVSFNGESRAYSINLLSSHEIVNDEVGGIKLSATW